MHIGEQPGLGIGVIVGPILCRGFVGDIQNDQRPDHIAGIIQQRTGLGNDASGFQIFHMGGAVFLTQMLAHGSHDHLAEGLVRWSLDIRYSVLDMPTGRDEVPGFVARSRRSPERVTKDAAAWRATVEAVPGAEEVANGVAAREMVRHQRL